MLAWCGVYFCYEMYYLPLQDYADDRAVVQWLDKHAGKPQTGHVDVETPQWPEDRVPFFYYNAMYGYTLLICSIVFFFTACAMHSSYLLIRCA